MKQNPNIDELLNGFIDGELTTRQQTEVKRLVANDSQIANRLRELQRCKMLVSSLPRVEAPVGMVEEIKNSLERRALLEQQPIQLSRRAGAWHLLARKVLAAAAMIALIAVLASVIYTIVAPQKADDGPVAVDKPPAIEVPSEKPEPMTVATAEKPISEIGGLKDTFAFNGKLELKTSNLIAVDAFINSAIEDNGLPEKVGLKSTGQRSVYTFSCSREALSLLLADLGNIWHRFDSAMLFIETDKFGEQIVVDAVTAEQIAEIAEQDSLNNGVRVAKDFAVLNNITERLPGREILKAIEDTKGSLITIPKPRLTSGEKAIKKPTSREEAEQKVYLTIVVEGS